MCVSLGEKKSIVLIISCQKEALALAFDLILKIKHMIGLSFPFLIFFVLKNK